MTEFHIPGYGKIKNTCDTKKVRDLFGEEVVIQEKIDGSQFSFCLMDDVIHFASKNREMKASIDNGHFNLSIKAVIERKDYLLPGLIYRGEALNKPKTNVLKYDRVPKGNVIIFDIVDTKGNLLASEDVLTLSENIMFESAPILFKGILDPDQLDQYLEIESILGGPKIEGIVIKPVRTILDKNGYPLLAKHVCKEFKEKHQRRKAAGKKSYDIVDSLSSELKTEARWQKAVQHLKDDGVLEGDMTDIRSILKEVSQDVKKEEEEFIRNSLFKWAWPKISKQILRGLPEWYKKEHIEK